jgi:DNA repair protein RecO (recombination protein O)
MSRFTDHSICLRRHDYSETSQVLTLFGRRYGKQSAMAKGVKRGTKSRFACGVDLLEEGECVLSSPRSGAGLAALMEWKQSNIHAALRRRIETLNAALYAVETTAALTEEADPHPKLFDSLAMLLNELSDRTDCLASLAMFQIVALEEAGLIPRFDLCRGCSRQVSGGEPAYFSSTEGGLVCRDCEAALIEKRRLPQEGRLAVEKRSFPSPEASLAAFDVLNYHIETVLGRPMRLGKMIRPATDRNSTTKEYRNARI